MLPQDENAERGLLGSFLLSPNEIGNECLDRGVTVDYFHTPAHQTIYTTLLEMWNGGDPIDFITLTGVLRTRNLLDRVGGPAFVTSLFTFVPTAANASFYILALREYWIRRKIIQDSQRLAERAYESSRSEGVDELVLDFRTSATNIGQTDASKDWEEISEIGFKSLVDFDIQHDPNCLLGNRWLCKGGAVLWIGQAGLGKSSMLIQAAMNWGCGADFFGIKPVHALKSLIIQAENDQGDLAEMIQGVMAAMRADEPDPAVQANLIDTFEQQLVFVRATVHTGKDFGRLLRKLVRKHKPDLVWIDPLLSYAGGDISKQEVASEFLRNILNPVILESGIGLMVMHHTGKPNADAKSKSHWNEDDLAYHAFGSSELPNWARAACVLRSTGEGNYELCFGKRRNRTGARDVAMEITNTIYLRHSEVGIYWNQVAKPDGVDDEYKPRKKVNCREVILEEMSLIDGMKASEVQRLIAAETGIAKSRFWQIWNDLKCEKKIVNRGGAWFKAGA